jgi:hypothetical protein
MTHKYISNRTGKYSARTVVLTISHSLLETGANGADALCFQAVARHMQAAGEDEMKWKCYLADFYEFHARDRFFDNDDLPSHLLDAKLFKR